jgi:hypothetical protein
MNTFAGKCQELAAISKRWETNKLFLSEAQKLINALSADASLLLTTGCNAADLNAHIRILKSVLAAQETWLWTQRETLLGAEITPSAGVQWVV